MDIYLTGGIGDFFAIDSHFSMKQRSKIERIYYNTSASRKIIYLFSKIVDCYPNIKKHIETHHKPNEAIHFSVAKLPTDFWGYTIYYNSSFLRKPLCEVIINLPERFFVIVPVSISENRTDRNFNEEEWNNTIDFLESKKMYGVVLGLERYEIEHELLINLTHQTSLVESIEILKKAVGYLGVDSCLSVLSTKLFKEVYIKSVADHCYQYKHVYYAPKTNVCLMRKIEF